MASLDDSGDWEDVSSPTPPSGLSAAAPSPQPAAAPAQAKAPAAQVAGGDEWEDVPQWRGYLPVAASAVAQSAVSSTGSLLAGLPELSGDYNTKLLANLDRIDRGEKVPMADDPIGYQDMDPETRKHTRADVEAAKAAYKPQETMLYKAGHAIKEFGEKQFPMSLDEQKSITAQAAGVVGGMAPYLAAGAVLGPEAAVGLGMAGMGLSSAHEQAEAARAKNASPEAVAEAARMGFYSGAAAGAVPLHAVMTPVERLAPGIADWARARLQHAAQTGVAFATLGEAQTWLGQQIAQNFYDPEAGYSLDIQRVLGGLLGGAFLGGMGRTPYRGAEQPAAEKPNQHSDAIQDILGGEPPGPPAPPGAPAVEPGERRPYPAEDDVSILGGDRPTGVPNVDDYVDQSMRNLRATSRTVAGTLDTSSTPGKEEKLVDGLTPKAAATQAASNYEGIVRRLYDYKDDIPTTGPEMGTLVNDVAVAVNNGIVKPGQLERTTNTKFPMQTRAEDLPIAYGQFSQELAERLSNPAADPVETAAWIEWRANMLDHFWTDGVGKTSKALAAIPLMRSGLPLPIYPPMKDFVAFAKEQPRVDPLEGGAAYLGPAWEKFNAFYHDMVYPQKSLQAALDRGATADELSQHPMVLNAVAENSSRVPTGTPEDFQNPEWRSQRVYNISGQPVRGWDAAVSALTNQASAYSGGQVEHGRHAVIVLGPPAAGKSSISEPVARKYRAAIVDPDDAKKIIPEYHNGLGTSAVHEESSELAIDVLKNIARDGGNIVLPKVGASADGIKKLVNRLKQLGYTVDIAHVAATPEISARRNIARFLNTGRLVKPEYITEVGDKPRKTAYMLRGDANDFIDADTSKGHYELVEGNGPLADIFRDGRNFGQGADSGTGRALGRAESEKGLTGEQVPGIPEHRVTAADGTAIDVAPIVVEASSLRTSQDPGYDTSLQPRQRDRAASQAQVRDIATNLDPERLGYSAEADRGAPIVGPDGMVESGNGRVLALRSVYEQGGPQAQAYRDWLTRQGVDVSGYQNPVLVRKRVTPMSPQERRSFTVAANQASTLSMSAPERAMADARLMDARSIGLIRNAEDIGAPANRDFVRRFVSLLPQAEQGAMADARGALSAEGLARVRNAVLAKAYGDASVLARIAESTHDEVRSISNALTAAAPEWARMRSEVEAGRVRSDMDATPDLLEAVKRTADIRSRGEKLENYLAQQDAFDKMPAQVEAFMRMFYDPKGNRAAAAMRIARALRLYAQEAAKVNADEGLGLGLVPVKPRDITRLALEREWEDYEPDAGVSDRGGLGDRTGGEEAGRAVRGPWLGEGRKGSREEGYGGDQESAVRAQRPERPFSLKNLTTVPGVEQVDLAGGKKGDQYVFPGTEKISAAELMRRRAAEPMRPKVEQNTTASGLFGDGAQQLSLLDAARKAAAEPVDKGPIVPQIEGTEAANASRGEPESGGIRTGTQEVPGGKPAGRARRATPIGRPEQLSLFGGGAGERSVFDANDAVQKQPGNTEAPAPGASTSVTKPPEGSRRVGEARHNPPAVEGLNEAQTKIAQRSRSNYRITDADKIGEGGPRQKIRGNLEAIRILKTIEDENRDATPGEKAALVQYVGWGAFAQDMFAPHKTELKAERDTLRSLVTDEEFNAARGSTLNAHFTSPDVVRGMWDAINHLGYDGGMAIEPAAGVGHFIGMIPDKVAPKTAWTAVELDPLTGRIAKALYGNAEVNVHGFEDLKRPSNYYDLAISNVPFGNYNISEKPYGSFPIHDFFFVKSLDKVRPGGVVAFVTSRYSMDRVDANTRRLLGKTADLVGAIRLPGGNKGAFAGNAGTQVTTDVMFLRKKIPGEAPFPGANWFDLKEIQTPDGPTKINEYFADHPEMMLGEMRLQSTMYRDNEPVLIGDAEGLQDRIAAAAQNMPKGAFVARDTPPPPPIHGNDIAAGIKDGAFFLQDGKLHQRREGQGFAHPLNAEDHDRVTRLVGMRDVVNDLLATQLAGGENSAAQAEHGRAKLRDAYDAFVAKHGPINKEERTVTSRLNKLGEPVTITRYPNIAKFMADPDAWKVAAIENYDTETGKAKRADIQTKDVIDAPMERQINGPSDALAASLDFTGGVDLDHIAQSLNLQTQEDVVRHLGDLVYQNPDGRKWETADSYLSGDVVKKLDDARAIAAEDTSYMRNVSALEKVQPEPLTGSDITAQFGAPWVPGDVYESFLKEIGGQGVKVKLVPLTGEWRSSATMYSRDARAKYGTDRVETAKIVDAALNNRQITVWDEHSDGSKSVNEKSTTEARVKTELLKETFTGDQEHGIDGWVFADPERGQRLEAIYNRTYNNLVQRKFDGTHLTLPGLNPDFATRQHRKDAVWRIVQNGNTLLAHDVGTGKTATMIAAAMEQKRLGLINKPMMVVPNHMLEQFSREFIQAYPDAKILVAQKDEMTRENRKAFLARVASNDWDSVIITHDAFGRINMGQEFRRAFIRDQLDELDRAIKAEAAESDKKSPTVKSLEKAKKKLQGRLENLMNEERKDAGTNFEESGVDNLFIDEAHCFPYNTMVQTDRGPIKIGEIVERQLSVSVASIDHRTGRLIWNPIHNYWRHNRGNKQFVLVKTDKSDILCTVNHRVFVDGRGYVRADEIKPGEALRALPEAVCASVARQTWEYPEALLAPVCENGSQETSRKELRTVRRAVSVSQFWKDEQRQATVLRQSMCGVMADGAAWADGEVRADVGRFAEEMVGARIQGHDGVGIIKKNACRQPDVKRGYPAESQRVAERADFSISRRQRPADEAAVATAWLDRSSHGICNTDEASARSISESAAMLQGGFGGPGAQVGYRGGRQQPSFSEMEVSGPTQDRNTECARVVSVEILERGSDREPRTGGSEDSFVYDLGVAGEHNYFANGVLVHNSFKNLAFITRMQRVKGLAQGDSQRAEDLFLKIQYLEQKRPGRAAVFATGTPVSNTMAELWTMQRYLNLRALKERGLDTFDSWASTFGRVVNNMELSADGRTFKEVSSFSKFVNVPELVSLYSEIADTKTADMLKLPTPDVKTRSGAPGIEIVQAEPSSQEEAHIQKLVELAESLKGKRPEKGQPNMLSVVTEGRKVATDGRLISPDFDFNPQGKIALGVNNIHRIWEEGNADPSAPNKVQMVFLDMGVPKSKAAAKKKPADVDLEEGADPAQEAAPRIDLYADIKKRLVDAGIPAKEIAAIHDATDDDKKAKLFQKVRNGEVRVILGSSGKMGVGTNVQDKLIAMHHFDAPWKPADVTQRDGRIVRQGNKNKDVQIYRYVTKRSFDAFMWQKLDTKSKFIGQVLSGAKGSRHAEDIDNPLPEAAEMKAAASGDPRIIEHAELDRQVRALSAQRRSFDATKSRAQWETGTAKTRIQGYEDALPNAKADAASVQDLAGDKFSAELGGSVVTDRKVAGQAILDRLLAVDARTFYTPKIVTLGKLSGFDMNVELRGGWDGSSAILRAQPSLKGKSGYGTPNDTVINAQTDPGGLIRRFENILGNIRQNPDRLERELAGEKDSVAKLEKTLGETWPKENDYRAALDKLHALSESLKAPKHPDVFTEEVKERRGGWDQAEGRDMGPKLGETAVRIGAKTEAHIKPTERYTAAEKKIANAVAEIGQRMAPQADVRGAAALRQNGNQIWGAFVNSEAFPHLVAWSLEKGSPAQIAGTVRHEIVHHLREAGLIRPNEWAALRDAAVKDDWLGKHNIEDRYPDLSMDRKVEEAVAEQFSKWRTERSIEKPGLIRDAFQRIELLFRRVAAAARSFMGKDATANDVFTRIETGEVGARHSDQIEAQKRYLAQDNREAAQTPGEENRKRREFARGLPGAEPTIRDRIVQAADALRAKAAEFSEKIGVDQIVRDMQMRVAPMAARDATVQSRAIAKEFINARRQSRQSWNAADKYIMDNFPPERRKAMWDAADEQSVAMQRGRSTVGIGLDRLPPDERRVVEMLQARGERNLKDANDLGMIESEGLPSYAPRMVVRMAEGKYEHGAGPGAEVVRDVRTLALANARLEDAIAARRLINSIEEVGKRSGNPTVNDGGAPTRKIGAEGQIANVLDQIGRGVSTSTPQLKHRKYLTTEETEAAANKVPVADKNAPDWFTLNHPAFTKLMPRMTDSDPKTYRDAVKRVSGMTVENKQVPARDEDGNIIYDRKPIYVRADFEGPLRAVLSKDTDRTYRALMALKGKVMSVIMMSPLIHNQVEWGRALPVAPGKVVTFQTYLEGNKVANDPKLMNRAIAGGVVPIGGHGYMQDIVSIAEAPTVRPGRSLTAKGLGYGAEGLGYLTRLYNPRSGANEVRNAVDWFGNVWHNRMLWDRIRDLQMGLWSHVNETMVGKGYDPYSANVAAAHFANRYAGALPIEAMSGIARGIANVLLFSRSFTLGNLGAYKDAILGLPRDAQAMIQQNVGYAELQKVQSYVKRKSLAMLAIDAGLYYATLSALQSAFNVAGVGHTVSTLGGMIAGGALGGKGGTFGRLAAAAGMGAAGFGLASVLGASKGTRDLEDELGRYWTRFSDLLGRVGEHPFETIGNPFKMLESLGSTAENEPGKKSRLLIGYQPDGTAIYARLAVGKVTEELMGYMTEPNEMLHRKLSTFARPLSQLYNNDAGFGHPVYDKKADTPYAVTKNIIKIAALIVGDQIPVDTIKGAMDWYGGGPGSEVSGMKAIAPFIGTTISKGFPGGPELGVLQDAKDRQKYRVQEALPGIREQIKKGDTEGAVAKMEELHIPRGLQGYYIRTTQDPASRLSKREMHDFMQYASPDEQREYENTQRNRPTTDGSAPKRADGGKVEADYDTALTPDEEASFQQWKADNAPHDSGADYDLRGAFKAGLSPAADGHWDDTFKKPNHPTFSIYSKYAKDRPELAGTWNGDQYIPPVPARAHGGRVEAANINHNPTEAQKHAGNYAKDHVRIHGHDITIENAKGKRRHGVGQDGKPWSAVLGAHYGYFKKSEARDGDHVDCYLGPHIKSPHVFAIDQVDHRTGKYDEAKICLGFANEKQALRAYEAGFSDGKGRDRIGKVHAMTVPQFRAWLKHGDTKRPFRHVETAET